MGEINLQNEGNAIKEISKILNPLEKESQKRIVEYVFKALKGPLSSLPDVNSASEENLSSHKTTTHKKEYIPDIRTLAKTKDPKSDIQKAVLVAFYLSEHKNISQVSAQDINKYFKQAGFRLPKNATSTLVNTKTAGYFEQGDKGKYKLNPVGYNLIAHSLPGKTASSQSKKYKRGQF